jgi:hypothetical protein
MIGLTEVVMSNHKTQMIWKGQDTWYTFLKGGPSTNTVLCQFYSVLCTTLKCMECVQA